MRRSHTPGTSGSSEGKIVAIDPIEVGDKPTRVLASRAGREVPICKIRVIQGCKPGFHTSLLYGLLRLNLAGRQEGHHAHGYQAKTREHFVTDGH
jgi:hypothetical protein